METIFHKVNQFNQTCYVFKVVFDDRLLQILLIKYWHFLWWQCWHLTQSYTIQRICLYVRIGIGIGPHSIYQALTLISIEAFRIYNHFWGSLTPPQWPSRPWYYNQIQVSIQVWLRRSTLNIKKTGKRKTEVYSEKPRKL